MSQRLHLVLLRSISPLQHLLIKPKLISYLLRLHLLKPKPCLIMFLLFLLLSTFKVRTPHPNHCILFYRLYLMEKYFPLMRIQMLLPSNTWYFQLFGVFLVISWNLVEHNLMNFYSASYLQILILTITCLHHYQMLPPSNTS